MSFKTSMTHGKKLLYFSSRSAKFSTLAPSHSSHHKARWRSPSHQLTTPLPPPPHPVWPGRVHTGHTQPPWLPANHCPQRWGGGQSLPTETGVVANHCPQRQGWWPITAHRDSGRWPITAHRDRGGGQSLPTETEVVANHCLETGVGQSGPTDKMGGGGGR